MLPKGQSDVYQNMKAKGIVLPPPTAPAGLYSLGVVSSGNLLFSSGKGWTEQGVPPIKGSLGRELTVEQGKTAARESMLCLLSNLQQLLGDLNKIKQVVKITGFIASDPGFYDQTKVLDGASQILIDIFGDKAGKSARTAIGVSALPMNMPVEVEAVFELEQQAAQIPKDEKQEGYA